MEQSETKLTCLVQSCSEGADIVTQVADYQTVCEYFHMFPSVQITPTGTALCSTHYRELYRHMYPTYTHAKHVEQTYSAPKQESPFFEIIQIS